jgi:CBS-domain-containing membrane protein
MNKFSSALIAGLGAFIAIAVLALLQSTSGEDLWLMAPFGATTVLVFGVPNSPLAQAKNVIFGHVITAFIGLCFVSMAMTGAWSMALATGLGVFMMLLTNTTHPPAGANPLLIILTQQDWFFLFNPVLIGAITIVFFGWGFNFLRERYIDKLMKPLIFTNKISRDRSSENG